MLTKATLLLSLAAGSAMAVTQCIITTTSVIYGFDTAVPTGTAVPSTCDREVNGLCVLENYGPAAQVGLRSRAVNVIGTHSGVASIDVCIDTYCSPNADCESVGFDGTNGNTCYVYSTRITPDELVFRLEFDVGFYQGSAGPTASSSSSEASSTTSSESSSTTEPTTTTSESSTSTTSSSSSTTTTADPSAAAVAFEDEDDEDLEY